MISKEKFRELRKICGHLGRITNSAECYHHNNNNKWCKQNNCPLVEFFETLRGEEENVEIT